ncbi:MAG: ATP-binding cassette domain-containing protein, partial [Nitrospinota bacterium]|nr:ATP-binding cassette domain-containing protein [Nitrospinota bacterium]
SGLVNMQLHEGDRSGKIVAEVEKINFGYGEKILISNFSTTILKGDRVGIIGPNGIGKTTLINILLGKIKPLAGKVRTGTGIQLTYFDQLREQLDETKNVRDNIGDGQNVLSINGNNRHVIGYLKDFLFSPEQALAPISRLSGGERNRLLLARLFTRPSNVLVLDEPTNDLDAETLELLEELLMQYKGTILLVSHDRSFINNIVTSTIVFEKKGVVKEYIGGYDDWIRQRPAEVIKKKAAKKIKQRTDSSQKKGRKLGYMEERELKALPEKIEKLEAEQEKLFKIMSGPDFYKQQKSEIVKTTEKVESLKENLNKAYKRWEELEK